MSQTCQRCGVGGEPDFSSEEKIQIFQTSLFDCYYVFICQSCLIDSQAELYSMDEFNQVEALKFRLNILHNYASGCQYSSADLQVKHIQHYEKFVVETNRQIDRIYKKILVKAQRWMKNLPLEESENGRQTQQPSDPAGS